jgi:hypothetical protein
MPRHSPNLQRGTAASAVLKHYLYYFRPQGPYRFYFFAGDRAEPAHIHVDGADGEAKFWLRPVALADAWGYSARELRTIQHMVVAHRDEFLQAWDAFFST